MPAKSCPSANVVGWCSNASNRMTWHAGKRAYVRGLQYPFFWVVVFISFRYSSRVFFALDFNRPQTTVYFTTWRAYGIYPLPNWWQQFYQDKDIRWRACPPFLLLCLKRIRRCPCGTRRRLYDDAWRRKEEEQHRCPPQLWTSQEQTAIFTTIDCRGGLSNATFATVALYRN